MSQHRVETIVDGVTLVTMVDDAPAAQDGTDGATPPSIPGTGIRGWLRSIYDKLTAGLGRTWTLASGTDSVTTVPTGTQAVSGTFWQATQPVSAAALPLPSNAAQETGGNLASILIQLTSLLATQTNGTQLVSDALLVTAIQQLQQSILTQTSIEVAQLRGLSIQSGQFIPVPEIPAFLGGSP